jgi:hypothetical protein
MSSSPHSGRELTASSIATESQMPTSNVMFEVLPRGRGSITDPVLKALQNLFVMTGMLVFPCVMGTSFSVPVSKAAHLYGTAFIGGGFLCAAALMTMSVLLSAGSRAPASRMPVPCRN